VRLVQWPICVGLLCAAGAAALSCGDTGHGSVSSSPPESGSSGGFGGSGAPSASVDAGSASASSGGGPSSGEGASSGAGSSGSTPPPPFTPLQSYAYVRKVKNLLTGLAPTAEEVASAKDASSLATLVDEWMGTPQFEPKLLKFFRNVFQQSQFAVADFEFQLRMRPGAFDLPYGEYGDEAFPLMFQNMQESVARTAFYYVSNGMPISDRS